MPPVSLQVTKAAKTRPARNPRAVFLCLATAKPQVLACEYTTHAGQGGARCLIAEVTALRNELAELRAEAKGRGAIDDVQARLDKIEQERSARQLLRTVGRALSA